MSRIEKAGSRFQPKFAPKKVPPKVIKPAAPSAPTTETSAPAPSESTSPQAAVQPVAAATEASPPPLTTKNASSVPHSPPSESPAPAADQDDPDLVEPTPPVSVVTTPAMIEDSPEPTHQPDDIDQRGDEEEEEEVIVAESGGGMDVDAPGSTEQGEADAVEPATEPLFRPPSPDPLAPAPRPSDKHIDDALTLTLLSAGRAAATTASTSRHTLDDEDLPTELQPSQPSKGKGKGKAEAAPKPRSKSKAKVTSASQLASQPNKRLGAARSREERKRLEVDSDDSGYDSEDRQQHAARKEARATQSQRMAQAIADASSEDESSSEEELDGPRPSASKRKAPSSNVDAGEGTAPPGSEEVPPAVKKPRVAKKPRAPRKRQDGNDATPIGKPRQVTPDSDEPAEPLDLSVVSMRDLCGDIKVGRLSQRGIELRQQKKSLKQIRKEARLRQKDKVASGPTPAVTAPGTPAAGQATSDRDGEGAGATREGDEDEDDDDDDAVEVVEEEEEVVQEDDEEGFRETDFVPQLTVNADGEFVIDQDSLQRPQRAASEDIIDETDILDERVGESRINSATFGKRKPTARWTKQDIEDLWEFVSMSGLNYLQVALWFGTYEDPRRPGVWHQRRSRQQVKKKLDKLQKLDPLRFDFVVHDPNGRKEFDAARYQEITGIDLGQAIEDPMAEYYKDLPGQERKNNIPEEEEEAKTSAAPDFVPEPVAYGSPPAVMDMEEEEEIIDE